MDKKPKYYLDKNGAFVIENYQQAKPFSSFFPGISGEWGLPLWVFYVNRGQAIASFGINDKDHPVVEFQPANKAYYLTPILGFRTFIKLRQGKKDFLYDAFSTNAHAQCYNIENSMEIRSGEISLKETNHTLNLEVRIEYFTIPQDNYPALARKVCIRNTGLREMHISILDGLPQVQPYGLNNMFLKQMSRTVEAWVVVENHDNSIPFFRLKVEPADRPEVVHIRKGNFYASFDSDGIIKPAVDPEIVFGRQGDFSFPKAFFANKRFILPEKQSVKSKTPCSFACKSVSLKPSADYTLYAVSGNMSSLDKLKTETPRIADAGYFNQKQAENRELIASLQRPVFTRSSSKELDLYCGQNFLDNIMRGGYPVSIPHASGRTCLYLYSRKHGDLERDYNMFSLEPACFSQGNGNYRDVNQNRRSDIWFNPDIGIECVLNFFNLIQADGYNPLVICPDKFRFNQDFTSLSGFFNRYNMKKIKRFLESDFTPGELFSFIDSNDVMIRSSRQDLLECIMENSTKHFQAVHGEGFWIDHWHYCLDMLESYIGLYPEKFQEILFHIREFTFFDNACIVQPREKRHVLHNGVLRQFESVVKNLNKDSLIKKRKFLPDVARALNGKGDIYKTNLIAKMIIVIANKFASLDPFGAGIEMEADKPNWYDSLNGLPGLLGSSVCETFELKRWILFLKDAIKKAPCRGSETQAISLPEEAHSLLCNLGAVAGKGLDNFVFWDQRNTLKEKYRADVLYGFTGKERQIGLRKINLIFDSFIKIIDKGLSISYDKTTKLYRSYFINDAVRHKEISKTEDRIYLKALEFRQRPLPEFLEGMVHAYRLGRSHSLSLSYHKAVRSSSLFDKKLNMYKVCAPLKSMPEEIGRTRVFTPGWLENESIWLHMEYKYMLELLKSGLYSYFYDDFKKVFVPFLKPDVYGRSILENSSFIVSSAFPEEKLHGNGFVARLSGSTAEFINIWLIMCAGEKPFYIDKKSRLCAEFKPVLQSWLFTKKTADGFARDTFSFNFLGKTLVVYHNPYRKNTFGNTRARIKNITMQLEDGRKVMQKSPCILPPYSYNLRSGRISRIDIELG
jgi:hypothetical protein